MKITKEKLKTLIKEELEKLMELELKDTGSVGEFDAAGQRIPGTGAPKKEKGLGDYGGGTTSAVKSKTEIGQGEKELKKMKAELDKIKDPAQHAKAIAHVMDKLGVTEKDLRLLLPKV
jgi:hypothetical protein